MKKITISYPDEQFEWLENHPEINKSGLFRAVVDYMMKKDQNILNKYDLGAIVDSLNKL